MLNWPWSALLRVSFTAVVVTLLAGAFDAGGQRARDTLQSSVSMAPLGLPTVRVMSFNIRVHTLSDGENDWPHRREMVSSVLRFHQADVLCLQEAYIDMIGDVTRRLPGFAWYGVGSADGRQGGAINPVFWRSSRFELVDAQTFWLSETPSTPGLGWDAAFPRAATLVQLRDIVSGRALSVLNVHLDSEGRVARQESARLLISRVRDASTIILGDFNCTEREAPCDILKRAGLKSARETSLTGHFGESTSFNDFSPKWRADYIIDHIFVSSDMIVQQEGIPAQTFDGKHASDHFPVLAELAP